MCRNVFVLALLLVVSRSILAEPLRVAVASNFAIAARALVSDFEQTSDHRVILLIGSTGKHTAQIVNGLPVDILMAADSVRPQYLETQGLAVANTRRTYAIGRLVLWSLDSQLANVAALQAVAQRRVAIANPKLAPYGAAAVETLKALELFALTKPQLVQGENVAQAYQFVHTGNANLGFVALSQVQNGVGSHWLVPADLHSPIRQQVILLRESPAGRAFLHYLDSAKALALIRLHGYDTP